MKRVLTVALVIAAAVIFYGWYASDERRIHRRLDEIADLVEKPPGESQIAGLNRARQVTELFAPDFDVRARQLDFETRDRQTLIRGIHAYRSSSERGTMHVVDTDVNVVDDRATVFATVEFVGGLRLTGGRELYRFQLNWVDREGQWLIDYVDLLDITDPGGGGLPLQ